MTAIIAVGALGVVGIVFGLDGVMLAGAMAIIGGLGGYVARIAVEARARNGLPP
jgi:mannitol-specific phosphotransferase system IIBC component